MTLRQTEWKSGYEKNTDIESGLNCELCGEPIWHLPFSYYVQHSYCPDCLHNETGQEWEDSVMEGIGDRDYMHAEFYADMHAFYQGKSFYFNLQTKEIEEL